MKSFEQIKAELLSDARIDLLHADDEDGRLRAAGAITLAEVAEDSEDLFVLYDWIAFGAGALDDDKQDRLLAMFRRHA